MACQILEHIPFDDFEKALSELKRVAKDYVVISLPRRCSCVEFVIKLPLIRSFFKRKFIDLSLVKSLKFKGFEESGQHYWEIDRSVIN
jgi:ubiquinone/menaquinone biosynthesis C-methylase UbiE